jgi:O-antigen ligase
MKVFGNPTHPGAVWQRRQWFGRGGALHAAAAQVQSRERAFPKSTNTLAFIGVYIFVAFLYLRPTDLIPPLGEIPLIKIISFGTLFAYLASRLNTGARLMYWTTEFKAQLFIGLLGALWLPLAALPGESWVILSDPFFKTTLIFFLMVNLIDSRERLDKLLKLVIAGGIWIGIGAIKSFLRGEFGKATAGVARIEGFGGGMFGNPNDLAIAMEMILPIALAYALASKGAARLYYLSVTALLFVCVFITYSRTGFLGLLAVGVVLWWKLGRGKRIRLAFAILCLSLLTFSVMPESYATRLATIFNPSEDVTGSAQERKKNLIRGVEVALTRPLIGVGMGNYHIYSVAETRAHNAFLEVSAELGMLGLLAYLILILKPLHSLRRVEQTLEGAAAARDREAYYISIGLQATLVTYLNGAFFSSIQYYWFLYFPVACAIALRRLYGAEKAPGEVKAASSQASALAPAKWRASANGLPRGAAWRPRQRRAPAAPPAVLPPATDNQLAIGGIK